MICPSCNIDKTFPLWDSVDKYLTEGLDFIQEGVLLPSCYVYLKMECFREKGYIQNQEDKKLKLEGKVSRRSRNHLGTFGE